MAYRKRRPMRRRRRQKRGWYSSAKRYGNMAYKAFRIASRLADVVNTEYKIHDYQATYTNTITYGGTVSSLVAIGQGAAQSQRVGDSIKLQNLMLRMSLGELTNKHRLRVIIFNDKNGDTVSTAADMLQTTGSAYSVISPKYYPERFRTKILYDRVFSFDADEEFQVYRKLIPLNFHVNYSPGTTSVYTNNLKILLINDSATGVGDHRVFARITYTDN